MRNWCSSCPTRETSALKQKKEKRVSEVVYI